jgi:hypothetical protein
MKLKLFLSVLMVFLIGATASGLFAAPTTTLLFNLDEVKCTKLSGYDVVELKGCHLAGEPGMPLLPCKAVNFVIPRGQEVSRVKVLLKKKEQIQGRYYLYPAQPDRPTINSVDAYKFVFPDAQLYEAAKPFPGKVVIEGQTMDAWDWKTYQVMVWPLEYLPGKREVWLYGSVEISLELTPGKKPEQDILPGNKAQHAEWAEELKQIVANPEDVGPTFASIQGPVQVVPRWVLILPGYEQQAARGTWFDAFQPLINWRSSQGLNVVVAYAEEIMDTWSGSNGAQKIRSYLQDQQANHGAKWACLVGDHTMIPWTYENPDLGDFNIPNDWYYCDLSGEWPEQHDWFPELWVGRVPCITTDEAENFVDKLLAYEQNPGNGDHDYLYRAFYEYADWGQHIGTCDWVIEHQDPAIQHTLWGEMPSWDDPNPTFPWDYQIVNELSTTHYNFVTVHCHGYTHLYWPLSIGNGQGAVPGSSFGLDDIEALWNNDYYYLWYSISCLNGQLDDETGIRSIAEGATCMYPSRCAIAFAGNTRYGYWTSSAHLQIQAWDILFPQEPFTSNYFNHAGGIEANSKFRSYCAGTANNYVRYSHNLFGDPATPIWTPRSMPQTRIP